MKISDILNYDDSNNSNNSSSSKIKRESTKNLNNGNNIKDEFIITPVPIYKTPLEIPVARSPHFNPIGVKNISNPTDHHQITEKKSDLFTFSANQSPTPNKSDINQIKFAPKSLLSFTLPNDPPKDTHASSQSTAFKPYMRSHQSHQNINLVQSHPFQSKISTFGFNSQELSQSPTKRYSPYPISATTSSPMFRSIPYISNSPLNSQSLPAAIPENSQSLLSPRNANSNLNPLVWINVNSPMAFDDNMYYLSKFTDKIDIITVIGDKATGESDTEWYIGNQLALYLNKETYNMYRSFGTKGVYMRKANKREVSFLVKTGTIKASHRSVTLIQFNEVSRDYLMCQLRKKFQRY